MDNFTIKPIVQRWYSEFNLMVWLKPNRSFRGNGIVLSQLIANCDNIRHHPVPLRGYNYQFYKCQNDSCIKLPRNSLRKLLMKCFPRKNIHEIQIDNICNAYTNFLYQDENTYMSLYDTYLRNIKLVIYKFAKFVDNNFPEAKTASVFRHKIWNIRSPYQNFFTQDETLERFKVKMPRYLTKKAFDRWIEMERGIC